MGITRGAYGATTGSSVALISRGTWAAATSYAVDDVVVNSGVRYVCKAAHTSSSLFATDATAKWTQTGIDSAAAATLAAAGTTLLGGTPSTTGNAMDAGQAISLPNAVSGDITVHTADGTPIILRVVAGVVGGSGGTPPSQVGTVGHTPGSGQVALTWSAPSAGTSSITDYVVQYKLSSSGTWLTFSDGVSATTGATVTGLTNGSAYDFRVAAVSAVGQGTYSTTVSDTPAGATTLVSDNFTRTDSPTVLGTATTGQTWAILDQTGPWGVVSNVAKLNTIDPNGCAASVDCGATDLTVSADIAGTRDAGTGLVFRGTDNTQYYLVLADNTTTAKFYKRVASTFTLVTNIGTVPANGTGFNFKVDVRGSAITVYVNGSSIGTSTDSSITTGTKVGIRAGDVNCTFDNFLVIA